MCSSETQGDPGLNVKLDGITQQNMKLQNKAGQSSLRNDANPSAISGRQTSTNYDEYRRGSKKSMHRIIAFTEKMRFEQKFAEHKIFDD